MNARDRERFRRVIHGGTIVSLVTVSLRPYLTLHFVRSVLCAAFLLLNACTKTSAPEFVPVPPPALPDNYLRVPTHGDLRAPDVYWVELDTTRGVVHLELERKLAPFAADHFYTLVAAGFYDGVAFHRVLAGQLVSAGYSGDPELTSMWSGRPIAYDTQEHPRRRGTVCLQDDQVRDRTTVITIWLRDDTLPRATCAVFGRALEVDVLDKLYAGYGELAPRGSGPLLPLLQNQGDTYLKANFPKLDRIRKARLVRKK